MGQIDVKKVFLIAVIVLSWIYIIVNQTLSEKLSTSELAIKSNQLINNSYLYESPLTLSPINLTRIGSNKLHFAIRGMYTQLVEFTDLERIFFPYQSEPHVADSRKGGRIFYPLELPFVLSGFYLFTNKKLFNVFLVFTGIPAIIMLGFNAWILFLPVGRLAEIYSIYYLTKIIYEKKK